VPDIIEIGDCDESY